MKRFSIFAMTVLIAAAWGIGSLAADEKKMSESPIAKMSQDELVKLALSAAPAHIAKDATAMVPGPDGKLMEARKGTNGFTCVPDLDGMSEPDPLCADPAAWQWANDLLSNAPKPTNTVPGVAYMAKGGWHFEKDGKILMNNEPGAKAVKEPPHWMIFWPFDSKMSGIPAMPNAGGVYVMFDGTPYSHLMIYQDPNKLK
jgi:hypothetical protein